MTSGSRLPSSRQPSRICLCHGPFQICKLPFSPSILVLEEKETHFDLEQMARPTSEAHHCLIGPLDPSRCHCLHCPSLQPTISLSSLKTLSSISSKTVLIVHRKKILGVSIQKCGAPRTPWDAKLTASYHFPRISPSFSSSLLRLVGAGNHNIPHWTLRGISRSYCKASSTLCFLESCSYTHTCSSGGSSHTRLATSIIDLNLKILLFCMWFLPVAHNSFRVDPHARCES